MFTGIVEAVAEVVRVEEGGERSRLWLDLSGLRDFDLEPGHSLCVDGVCLTAAAVEGPGEVAFDLIAETLHRTTLGRLRPGSVVNVERALRPTDRLGGHFLQGHIDGTGRVMEVLPHPGQTLLRIRAPQLREEMVLKGSVGVAGVSLTVAELLPQGFGVALVPFTLRHTTLGRLRPGDAVNIETDIIGKYVRAFLRRATEGGDEEGGMSEGFLREHGFA